MKKFTLAVFAACLIVTAAAADEIPPAAGKATDPPKAEAKAPEKPPESPTIESVTKERDAARAEANQCQAVLAEVAPLAKARAAQIFGLGQ